MHISSLPSPFGIGTLGKTAYEFVDWLKASGFTLWQILPLNPTSFGNSPYMSPSGFAGNPFFIDLEKLTEDGFLKQEDYWNLPWGNNKNAIDYGLVFEGRQKVFNRLFENFRKNIPPSFDEFCKRNQSWLQDFALYFAIKNSLNGAPLKCFPKELKIKDTKSIKVFEETHSEEILKIKMLQFFFYEQWIKLKNYANQQGVLILGDMPFYVAEDSCDIWANSQNFLLDDELKPTRLAGCPPDDFSPLGQLWGNPLYDWEHLKNQNYEFLINRLAQGLKIFDVLRIDHFRGFESFYSVKKGEESAINGSWVKGGGMDFIKVVNEKLPKERIIAEDLGFRTKEVDELLNFSGYAGMKVLQFAFQEEFFLPHFYSENSVVYTGTHDNETLEGKIKTSTEAELEFICDYMKTDIKFLRESLIIEALKSVCRYAIFPIQDVLGLGNEGRMNLPGKTEGNWEWRLEDLNKLLRYTDFFKNNNKLYGRS